MSRFQSRSIENGGNVGLGSNPWERTSLTKMCTWGRAGGPDRRNGLRDQFERSGLVPYRRTQGQDPRRVVRRTVSQTPRPSSSCRRPCPVLGPKRSLTDTLELVQRSREVRSQRGTYFIPLVIIDEGFRQGLRFTLARGLHEWCHGPTTIGAPEGQYPHDSTSRE